MSVQDRTRQLRVVAEILLVHIPEFLDRDLDLARDLLAVVGTSLHTIHEDVERSARAWDKRAYDVKSDQLRREWAWVPGAANYATGLALRREPLTASMVAKLRQLIGPKIEKPARRQIHEPERFRGAMQAVRRQLQQQRAPVRE